MKDNTIVLIVAEAGCLAVALLAMCLGEQTLAAGAAGALVGVVGGHLNGTEKA